MNIIELEFDPKLYEEIVNKKIIREVKNDNEL